MRNLLKNLQLIQLRNFLFLLPLIFLANCEKDPSLPGTEVGDNLAKLDSTVLVAYTKADEPRTALNASDVVIGRLVDARFGTSKASFYTQCRLTTTAFTPGANAVLDSAVLVLTVEGSYGPLTQSIDFEVYRLNDALDAATTYESNTVLNTGTTLLGGLNAFNFNDHTSIRIPLTNTFGNELFSLFGSTTTSSNDNFLAYLNGLFVTLKDNTGGDGLIDLDMPSSVLNLYFHSDVATDSLYTFTIDAQALRVNQYVNDLSGSEVEAALIDLTNNDENIYVSGLSVSKGAILLPDLSVLQGAVINQAKLTFYQTDYSSSANTGYDLPDFILLTGSKDNDTIPYFLSDYSTSNPSAYGGVPSLVEVNGSITNAISYNLPIFFQRVVNQETEVTSLNLEVLNYNNGNRIKLGGGNHPSLPITLEILYTKP